MCVVLEKYTTESSVRSLNLWFNSAKSKIMFHIKEKHALLINVKLIMCPEMQIINNFFRKMNHLC